MYGLEGDDSLDGGAGNDNLYGGEGNDILRPGTGDDFMDGGAGSDTVDMTYTSSNLIIRLADAANQITFADGFQENAVNIENAIGGSGNDLIIGTHEANRLEGYDGNDRLIGGMGDDYFDGGLGSDVVELSGIQANYTLTTANGYLSVFDNIGTDGLDILVSVEQLRFGDGETINITSPIIFDLNGDGVQTSAADKSGVTFDLDGDGIRDRTSWISNRDAFLYFDRNGDGTMSDASEISFVDDVAGAPSDLAGLAAFDSNGDGVLDENDERFGGFGIWRDANSDGNVDEGEISNLANAGIVSIGLTGSPVAADARFGQVAVLNTGTFTYGDGQTGSFADTALTYFAQKEDRSVAPVAYDFDRKSRKYRLSVANGSLTVVPKKAKPGIDRFANQLGANSLLTFGNRSYGMFAAIALDLDGDGIELRSHKKSRALFDFQDNGQWNDTGWLSGDDGFLVVDRNGDGQIDATGELSLAAEVDGARIGIEGLVAFDTNGDGIVSSDDGDFASLKVWRDRNENGRTDMGELVSLTDAGIEELRLSAYSANQARYKIGLNALIGTTSFVRSDGSTSTMADVALAYRPSKPRADASFATSNVPASPREFGDRFRFDETGRFEREPFVTIDRFDDGRFEAMLEALKEGFGAGDQDQAATGGEADTDAKQAMVMPNWRERALDLEVRTGPNALPGDAELARKLAMIRQDMGMFAIAGMDERLHREERTFGVLELYS